jgi:hypothetical protein
MGIRGRGAGVGDQLRITHYELPVVQDQQNPRDGGFAEEEEEKRREVFVVVAVCFLNCLYNNKIRPFILFIRLHLICKFTAVLKICLPTH